MYEGLSAMARVENVSSGGIEDFLYNENAML